MELTFYKNDTLQYSSGAESSDITSISLHVDRTATYKRIHLSHDGSSDACRIRNDHHYNGTYSHVGCDSGGDVYQISLEHEQGGVAVARLHVNAAQQSAEISCQGLDGEAAPHNSHLERQ